MKTKAIIVIFFISAVICYSGNAGAQNNKVKDEKTFVKCSDEVLSLMEKKATELSMNGVAIIGFIPGEKTTSWITKMRVVGSMTNANNNLLGIAYSKASDMAVTLQNSGTDKARTVLKGEFGYQGGLIKKIKNGYIIAVFSGGKTEQDLQVAQEGLNAL